jgi:phenylacetate-CoA ligase
MSNYFDEVDHRRLLAEYPIGQPFLEGPARLSRDALHALQERRFLAVVARGWKVPFYRRRWQAAGLERGDIRALEDVRKLPAFSKSDLMESVAEHPPFGDFHGLDFGVTDRLGAVLHTTSGTTGAPQPIWFGAFDREVQNALLARAYRLQGLTDSDVVHSVYGFGMVNGGHYIRETVLHFTKALLVSAGTGLETRSEQQIELMRRYGASVIVGFPDYIRKLAAAARAAGLDPARDLKVRKIIGHIGRENRTSLSQAWGGAEIFDWYGVADTGVIAAEGRRHDGLHVFEDAHLSEIVDPDTGAALPDGKTGNICATVLFKTGVYPVIRFDTKDLSRLLPPDPGSGINFRRIAGFLGRSDNMVKLRGINVYPSAVGAVLGEIAGLTGEYVCRVTCVHSRDEMTVVAEANDPNRDATLAKRVADALRHRLGVELLVELVAPGETAPFTQIDSRQKPIRLIDARQDGSSKD